MALLTVSIDRSISRPLVSIVVIAVAVVFIVKCRNMKKQKEELEDQLAAFDAENVPTSTDKL